MTRRRTVQPDVALRYLARRERRRPDTTADAHQRALLTGISGIVLEIGCGEGSSFARLPTTVSQVIAVEPRPGARRLAAKAAAQTPFTVDIRDRSADDLPVATASVDAAISRRVLCSVETQARALAEIHRVLRPEGELRFYEHVRAPHTPLASLQRALDATICRGCSPAATPRATPGQIPNAGFTLLQCHAVFHSSHRLTRPAAPSIVGIARPT